MASQTTEKLNEFFMWNYTWFQLQKKIAMNDLTEQVEYYREECNEAKKQTKVVSWTSTQQRQV